MVRRGGLGRGLDALIPRDITGSPDTSFREVPISAIKPNPLQPRRSFDEEALLSLVNSIKEVGLLQPVLVRAINDTEYELIAGERRWRAARRAGLQSIPVLIEDTSDMGSLQRALVENIHREDLSPLEEAAAYQQLIEEFGLTHEEVAKQVGKGRATITNTLRLLQLPAGVQRLLAEGAISAGHARALLGTPDRAFQEELAVKVAREGWSVRATEEAVRMKELPEQDLLSPVDLEKSSSFETSISTSDSIDPVGNSTLLPITTDSTISEIVPNDSSNQIHGADSLATKPSDAFHDDTEQVEFVELEQLLERVLNTRVHVEANQKRGKIIIEFYDLEDLERIYTTIIADRTTF